MVPDARFSSYYGRPIVRASPWSFDIPAYVFLGGLAGGSSLLGAGADLTNRPGLRRSARATALGAISFGFVGLIHDLGRPARFHHMLRVAKPTSPMSVGTWLLTGYAPLAAVAAASELADRLPKRSLRRLLPPTGRAAGIFAAGLAPAVASYTAVLLSDTATPSWHEGRHQMPYVFVGSAAAAAGGAAMVLAPTDQGDVARAMAIAGAVTDLACSQQMVKAAGLAGQPFSEGHAGKYMKAAKALTAGGAALAAALGARSRTASVVAGAALVAGSACTRFGIFHAGQQSARDPKYTVVPQRERQAARVARGL